MIRQASLSAAFVLLAAIVPAGAADMPSFGIEFKDGTISPMRLEVPANTAFRLELHNTGKGAAEFESTELQREKVMAPDSSTFVVIRRLDPGEYKFFDDFVANGPQALIVAK